MAELEVPCFLEKEMDASVFLKPPFVVSYESMAVDAGLGKNQRVNTEMVNKWCLMPKFIHILWAHKMNMSLVEAAKDPRVAQIVIYAMRHHVHNHGFSNLVCHACVTWYGLDRTHNMADGSNNMIMAALYLTEIVNAALTTMYDNDGAIKCQETLKDVQQKQLIGETYDVTMLFSTMNIYAGSPGIDTMINQLGKNIFIL